MQSSMSAVSRQPENQEACIALENGMGSRFFIVNWIVLVETLLGRRSRLVLLAGKKQEPLN